jgi:hypothetical protein
MLATLALLAAVVSPFDPARLAIVSHPLIDLSYVGTRSEIRMPWGDSVTITFRGQVPTFNEIPSNAEPFDMWQTLDRNYWFWVTRLGRNHYQWVDP